MANREHPIDRLNKLKYTLSFIATAMTMETEVGHFAGDAREGMIMLLQDLAAEAEEIVDALNNDARPESEARP
jgi:ABC-type tungstate transport system substrate-binding protein